MQKKYLSLIVALGLLSSGALALPASADTNTPPANRPHKGFSLADKKAEVFGTVASISGTTITVTGKARPRPMATPNTSTTVTYTVDASSATVIKNNATSSVSNIALGDTIAVHGDLNGTNIKATIIRDGAFGRDDKKDDKKGKGPKDPKPKLTFQGNGQPVLGGTITAINGSTLTVTNMGNVSYTVDVTNANIQRKDTGTSTVSDLKVNDVVAIQGTVSGTSVTASAVIDRGVVPAPKNADANKPKPGFWGGVKGFFGRVFGF